MPVASPLAQVTLDGYGVAAAAFILPIGFEMTSSPSGSGNVSTMRLANTQPPHALVTRSVRFLDQERLRRNTFTPIGPIPSMRLWPKTVAAMGVLVTVAAPPAHTL